MHIYRKEGTQNRSPQPLLQAVDHFTKCQLQRNRKEETKDEIIIFGIVFFGEGGVTRTAGFCFSSCRLHKVLIT